MSDDVDSRLQDPTATAASLEGLALSRSELDRAARHRPDAEWLARRWVDPDTRVLVLDQGRARVTGEPPVLVLVGPEHAPPGTRLFLGLDGSDRAHFAVVTDAGLNPDLGAPEAARWAGLREVGALLDATQAGMLVHAVALANWHAGHTHCPRCGARTEPVLAGSVRRCTADGTEHYPRTDPAVIMAVIDGSDRLLLGHQPGWPEGRFSTLAGFVEPGESLEQAVRREVAEEVGVRVGRVDYLGSQPWPFPSSLMLGFRAHAEGADPTVDGEEITEARWFSRDELTAAMASRQVLLPPRVSIARRLIEHWYGAELDDANRW